MEFLEYYRVIKERIWLVLVTTGVILLMVVIYQMTPPSTYEATGSLRVNQGADQFTWQRGNEAVIGSNRLFWDTFIQVGESRELVREAAARIGITGPDIVKRLKSFDLKRPSRSNIVNFTAYAEGPKKAVDLAQAGMQALIEYWRRMRLTLAEEVRKSLAEHLTKTESDLQQAEAELKKYESPNLPGTPEDQMLAVQQELLAVQSQLASARIELSLAQDRASAVRQLAREEANKPLSERAATASPEVASLQQQKAQLELRLTTMLQKKTREHPDVKALEAQIAEIDKKLKEQPKKQGEEIGGPFQEQILNAELDARAARGKITALEKRLQELQSQLPALRERAKAYKEAAQRVDQVRTLRDGIRAQVRKVEAEITRLKDAKDIEILDRPRLAPSPKTMKKFLLLFVAGGFMGLVLGSMLALVMRYVDITVKNEQDVAQMLGKRTLAIIPRFEEVVGVESGGEAEGGDTGVDEGLE
ncbi:MAG: hypothetical protein J7M26_08405 [Armatimonadetes bacterium]|nr:hypothetical protein [Armatimonadota bacterium]